MVSVKQLVVVAKDRLHRTLESQKVALFNEDGTPYLSGPQLSKLSFGGNIQGTAVEDDRWFPLLDGNVNVSLVVPPTYPSMSGSLFDSGTCEIENLPINEFGWTLGYNIYISNFVLNDNFQWIRVLYRKEIEPGIDNGEIVWEDPEVTSNEDSDLTFTDGNVWTSQEVAQYSAIVTASVSIND